MVTNLALAVALGPWALLRFLGTLCFGWGSLVVQLAQAVGQGFLVGWKSVRLGLQVAPSVAGSAKDVGSQVNTSAILFAHKLGSGKWHDLQKQV